MCIQFNGIRLKCIKYKIHNQNKTREAKQNQMGLLATIKTLTTLFLKCNFY